MFNLIEWLRPLSPTRLAARLRETPDVAAGEPESEEAAEPYVSTTQPVASLLEALPRGLAVALILACGSVLIVIVTAFIGGFTIITGVSNLLGPATWTPTPCTILSFDADSRVGDDPESAVTRVAVEYRYAVGEKKFTATRYSYSTNYTDQIVVEPFKPGPATCYVNPSDPASAVLVRGFNVPVAPIIAPGLIILIVVVLAAVRRWNKPDRRAGDGGLAPQE